MPSSLLDTSEQTVEVIIYYIKKKKKSGYEKIRLESSYYIRSNSCRIYILSVFLDSDVFSLLRPSHGLVGRKDDAYGRRTTSKATCFIRKQPETKAYGKRGVRWKEEHF